MIDVYYWPTPNCWKVTIALEELGLPYRIVPVNIRTGAQREPSYRAICPNERVPSIVDHEPEGGGRPVALFESGAILQYLAEKSGALLPTDLAGRWEVLTWLNFQVANLGPTAGQVRYFRDTEREPNGRAILRFVSEIEKLYRVLDARLAERDFIAGRYSIADIAMWPFILPYERAKASLAEFKHLERWAYRLLERPAVIAGMDVGAEFRPGGPMHARVCELLEIARHSQAATRTNR